MKKAIIIGAGLGGLAAACRLAAKGFRVTVLEKTESSGGKVNLVEAEGFRFDTGASLVTMKHVFEELFEFCGRRIGDHLTFERLDPICRYFWADGTRLDASDDIVRTEAGIRAIEPADADGFRRYLNDSRTKYEIAERTFLAESLDRLPRLLTPRNLPDLFRISTLRTLDRHNARYFRSPKIRQLFNRFATYNGSSPYRSPAAFALIPYVEFGLGAWYVRGGIYRIPAALEELAVELGAEFRFGAEVERILVEGGRAEGVRLSGGETLRADVVLANADAVGVYRSLIDPDERKSYTDRRLERIEPSCSGFVLLLGTDRKYERLAHHNIFFSEDYRAEFEALFEQGRPAAEPTIYVCASSRTDATQAPPGGENLFVLVNAPATGGDFCWEDEKQAYRDLVVSRLEGFGLGGLGRSVVCERVITPEDFERRYRANRGSIYGVSSNGILSAFMRFPNKARDIRNLYFAGGTTHPGGGMPLVLLSGRMASDLILEEHA